MAYILINIIKIDNTFRQPDVGRDNGKGNPMLQTRVDSGLDGVIVADTVMSEVDGEAGRLIVRGHAIEELIATRGFEGVAALLWEGYAEGGGDEAAVRDGPGGSARAGLRRGAEAAGRHRAVSIRSRRCASASACCPTARRRRITSWSAAPCRCSWRRCSMPRRAWRRSRPIRRSRTAQDLLRMIRGQRAGEVFEKALDTYLATIADHGFNASTFTARVVASTHAGLISSVLAALCALKGPLHGGAPGPGARHAGRDRRGLARRGVVRRRLRQGHDPDGLRPSHLQGARSARRRAEGGRRHAAGDGRAGWPMPRRSRRAPSPRCAGTSPAGGSTPMSSTTPRCCSRRWRSRAAPSPRCSRSAAPPAGARTSSSRRRAAASSARSRTTSGRGLSLRARHGPTCAPPSRARCGRGCRRRRTPRRSRRRRPA